MRRQVYDPQAACRRSVSARNDSYGLIIDKLPESRRRVFDFICVRGPHTSLEIAESLKTQHSSVTGRIFELRRMGLVVFHCYTQNPYGSKVSVWGLSRAAVFAVAQGTLNFKEN